MLQIRREQFHALESELSDFESMVLEHLRGAYSEDIRGKSDGELLALVRRGIQRAWAHGFDELSTCAQFVGLQLELGPDFDRAAWAAEILADDHSGDARLDVLLVAAEDHDGRP